jgi:pyridoxamine 5'-phosphate oxidase
MTIERLGALTAIEAEIWRELQRATDDRHHEWRTLVLASVALDGGADARSVVLREADPQARRLVFYSDGRGAKIRQLLHEPRATLVCWSRRLGWQLRLRAHCRQLDDDIASSQRWKRVMHTSGATDYLATLAPGTALAGLAAGLGDQPHFAVIEADVASIDWLELDRAGHRRAVFNAAGGRWLQP